MNTKTGEIASFVDLIASDRFKVFEEGPATKSDWMPMAIPPTAEQLKRNPPRVGRNEPCGCGSGKKFKNCHQKVMG